MLYVLLAALVCVRGTFLNYSSAHFLFTVQISLRNATLLDFNVYLNDNIPLKVALFGTQNAFSTLEDYNNLFCQVLQGYSKIAYFGTVFVSYSLPGINPVNYTLSSLSNDVLIHPFSNNAEFRKVLLTIWGIVSNEIVTALFPCYDNIANENILLVAGIPNWVPLGIGSILKTFASLKSVHANTKFKNLNGYLLGNYSSIIEADQLVDARDVHVFGSHIIELNAYRLVVLRDEEPLIPADSVLYHRNNSIFTSNFGLLDNKHVKFIQSTSANVDALLDCSVIPDAIVQRILHGVRQIRFRASIVALAESILGDAGGGAGALGVSIRSFQAPHEVGDSALHNETVLHEVVQTNAQQYSAAQYQAHIRRVLSLRPVTAVILAYDNPDLLVPQHAAFVADLRRSGVTVIEFDGYLRPHGFHLREHSLEKAAVELLVLARTSHLLGNKDSTFLDMVYWLGECRQEVFGV